MFRKLVQNNVTITSILLFFLMFGLINQIKPTLVYDSTGSIRQFGVGYKHKTILPIWLLSIILSILSYMAVMYYLAYPTIGNY